MKYTNKFNLPSVLEKALTRSDYKRSLVDKRYSVTSLLQSPREYFISRRHDDEVTVDITENINKFIGNAIHAELESCGKDTGLNVVERYMSVKLNEYTLTGKLDIYNGDTISDYKTVTIYSFNDPDMDYYTKQVNMYLYMLRKTDPEVAKNIKKLNVVLICKDWSKTKAGDDENYSQSPIKVIDLKMFSIEEQEAAILKRLNYFDECSKMNDNSLPLCTREEMFQDKNDRYEVWGEGNKRASHIAINESEASEWINNSKSKSKYSIKIVEPRKTKCLYYCNASEFCNQYKTNK